MSVNAAAPSRAPRAPTQAPVRRTAWRPLAGMAACRGGCGDAGGHDHAARVSRTLRLLTSSRGWQAWRLAGAVAGGTLAVIIVASYTWNWKWTGFAGKQLWDWLHLMLFQVVVVLLPDWVRRGEPFGPRQSAITTVVLAGFAVLLVDGYRWGWTWTGFTGDSFRDWLNLVIAPYLLSLSCRLVHAYHSSRGVA
jgi:hypothetical protein